MSMSVQALPRRFVHTDASGADWRAWKPFLGVSAAFIGGSAVIGPLLGWAGFAHPLAYFATFVAFGLPLLCLAVLLMWLAAIWQADVAAGRTLGMAAAMREGARAALPRAASLAGRVLLVLTVCAVATAAFTGWRVSIPSIVPFGWDRSFDRLDALLHGGYRPWEVLHHALGTSAIAGILDLFYSKIWFLTNGALVLVAAALPPRPATQRILVSFILQYALLGAVVATIFSSAGPIYYGRVLGLEGGADPYAALPAALDSFAELRARWFHDVLWSHYVDGTMALGTGITAFPSLHLSAATLLALALGRWNRCAGLAGWGFVTVTLVGSVYLGWHYAVDGYASILAMIGIWWWAGRMTGDRARAGALRATVS